MQKIFKFIVILVISFMITNAYSSELKDVKIIGNERIPDETVLMFANVKIGEKINNDLLNNILKNIYNSLFFKNVSVELNDEIITIKVEENPIIQNINYQGIKSKKILKAIKFDLKLKPRSSYSDYLFEKDKNKILNTLKDLGYYFPKVETYVIELENNKVDLNFKINLGEKSKIKKISFIGNKIYKDKKLRSLIVSEEYKFWKIISGKKFLNENIIQLDERLLKNFYLNKGYYNVRVNSSFAKMLKNNEFELIFNIQPNEKIYFNELSLILPDDFEESDFSKLMNFFNNIKGEPYSINRVENIIEEIEIITINEQNLTAKASIEEKINGNKQRVGFRRLRFIWYIKYRDRSN